MKRLQSIQVLRGAAALMVVYAHAMWSAREVTGSTGILGVGGFEFLGRTGIDLFFVISGFIIAQTMDRYSAGDFLHRRWWRVAPLFYLASVPFIVRALIRHEFTAEQMATTLSFWPVWGRVQAPFLSLGWTLCYEMLFYAGAAAALALGRKWPVLAAFAVCCALGRVLDWPVLQFLGNPIIIEFLVGCWIARLSARPGGRVFGAVLVAAGLSLLVFAALSMHGFALLTDWQPTATAQVSLMRDLVIGIPAALILYGVLQFDRDLGHAAPPLVLLGDASYSLYLCHPTVQLTFGPLLAFLPTDLVIVAVIALSVSLALTVHRRIEQPLLELPRKLAAARLGGIGRAEPAA